MTEHLNSPDSQLLKKGKSTRKSGPIRFEAIGPIAIVLTLIFAYSALFLDLHLKKFLQWGLSFTNGAEVNIAGLQTSFTGASLDIRNIEMTDPEDPQKNRLQIGQVHLQMLWDGLLRGKFVVTDARMEGLQIQTLRRRAGWVAPPPKVEPGDLVRSHLLDFASRQFADHAIGDLASILQGTDPTAQIAKIEGELKTQKRIKEIELDLKNKEEKWQKRFAELPQEKDFVVLSNKLKTIKTSNFQSPQEVQTSLTQLQNLLNEIDAKLKLIERSGQELKVDINQLDQDYKNLQAFVREDLKALEKRLQLPSLEVESMTKSLFGAQFAKWLSKGEQYRNRVESYMPPPKKASGESAVKPQLKPRERARGVNYAFGRPNSYPLFWLKLAKISSRAENSPFAGELEGSLSDLSSAPELVSRPTLLSVNGDFPGREIRNLKMEITFDHRTANPRQNLVLEIGAFAVGAAHFVQSDSVTFGMNKATGQLQVKGTLQEGQIELSTGTEFENIDYAISASHPEVASILKGVSQDLPAIRLQADIKGPWDDLSLHMQSNLGDAIVSGFRRQIQERVEKARQQLALFIEQRVTEERKKLQDQIQLLEQQLNLALQQAQSEANKAKDEVQTQAAKAQNQAQNAARQELENAGKKALEDLKKKFKF